MDCAPSKRGRVHRSGGATTSSEPAWSTRFHPASFPGAWRMPHWGASAQDERKWDAMASGAESLDVATNLPAVAASSGVPYPHATVRDLDSPRDGFVATGLCCASHFPPNEPRHSRTPFIFAIVRCVPMHAGAAARGGGLRLNALPDHMRTSGRPLIEPRVHFAGYDEATLAGLWGLSCCWSCVLRQFSQLMLVRGAARVLRWLCFGVVLERRSPALLARAVVLACRWRARRAAGAGNLRVLVRRCRSAARVRKAGCRRLSQWPGRAGVWRAAFSSGSCLAPLAACIAGEHADALREVSRGRGRRLSAMRGTRWSLRSVGGIFLLVVAAFHALMWASACRYRVRGGDAVLPRSSLYRRAYAG